MQINSLRESFIKYCEKNDFEKNSHQLVVINSFISFLNPKKNFLNFLSKPKEHLCFYLFGGVGVGKTMILNFIYDFLYIPKRRLHFNEFMINFHNFRHKMKKKNKENSLNSFVKDLKKYKIIYLDEFQVTNIVDAMILGKLFETIFNEGIKIIITSNIQIENLYKDGLQREQFLPFISIIKDNSIQHELILEDDYRKLGSNKLQRAFFPNNKKNIFKINQLFRKFTKNKKNKKKSINVKGRNLIISDFYEGIARFDFKQLCDVNIGSEDYLEIAKNCKFIVIENIPKFNNENFNQQQRFITMIDIFYDKKIFLMISLVTDLDNIGSSVTLRETFKRTLSRLYELTSPNININKLFNV